MERVYKFSSTHMFSAMKTLKALDCSWCYYVFNPLWFYN